MLLTEVWKPIEGYEGLYQVSNFGNIKSLITNQSRRAGIIKPHMKNGYYCVNLYKNKKVKHMYVHRIVANTFIENIEKGKEVNHIDCNKLNNKIENLEWCNRKQNLEHSYKNGLKRTGEKHGMHKLTKNQVEEIRQSSLSQKELSQKFNVKQCTISAIQRYKLWKEGDN